MSVPAPNPLVYLQPRMALQVVAYLDGPLGGSKPRSQQYLSRGIIRHDFPKHTIDDLPT